MTKVLLTGGSGFIAAHILDILLEHGHSVITTVRSQEKAAKIIEAHPKVSRSQLDFRIVPDIAQPGAFDEAVKIDGLKVVIHTASPFHFNATDMKRDLIDPAVNGTRGVLSAIKNGAPTVKRVVITSSYASILDPSKDISDPTIIYSEKDWNPISEELALQHPVLGYLASKTFAEKAAWEFIQKEKPNFTLTTINPPLVLGPVINHLNSLESLNTSNQCIRDFTLGKLKTEIPEAGCFIWADVRDVALAHVKAFELDSAAGKRCFVTAGFFSNREIAAIIKNHFPEYVSKLPGPEVKGGDYPEKGPCKFDNSKTNEILGIKYYSLERSVVDAVKSFKRISAGSKM
ncbi:BgTH12-03432 [Blumeria graminis f. sp. triticale]|uniref:BgtA-21538 n=3 Tax=Blumeria graminis TaxID=34373 RepID=A0A9X9L8M4_BLUGR|nr:hypothetical protein BGT96224_A21538 [Blumeria graminis f. sp. tritici 96224]CAD6499312.1 BgTH12-03432 [Blumeria graminis f. sp. triticale]VCU39434.1 BgtA-21538 [Blumeria graminis f. sp. tritici]